jgi:ribosomal protein S12 methylthiotransferase
MKKNKIGIITLGCSKNTVDSERLISQLKLNKFDISADPEKSDTVIINTCGFIEAAKEESINTILSAVELKKAGKLKKVIVTGCLSQRYKDELIKEIPEVDVFFGTEDYEGILKNLGGSLKYELLGEREISTPKHYAYLKISEGCDNPCSFCAIPLIRGKHKSIPIPDLLKETELLANKGVKELVIIGQDTTDYGKDIYGKRNLAELMNKLSLVKGIEWIRLLYAYPSHFPDDVLDLMAGNPKICKYLDMPLQHISDKVLKSMRRGITSNRTRKLINKIREKVPGITLRTTFIVGFPNETDKEFEELCNFVQEMKFDRIGAFTYSIEENTSCFNMEDSVPQEEKEDRLAHLMEIQNGISFKKNKSLIGHEIRVIIDRLENNIYYARSEKDAPEVDGDIIIPKGRKKIDIGKFYNIKITSCSDYDLSGKII